MKRILTVAALLLAPACAPATGGIPSAPGGGDSRGPGIDITVSMQDESTRTPVHPRDVAVMTYFDEPWAPGGCAPVARMYLEATIAGRMRAAVTERAGELGANLVVIADRQEHFVETTTSRTGIGRPQLVHRYTIEAFDCR